MITIQFTNDEAATLLEILTKTPLPHNVSHALIVKVGTALQLERQADDMRKMQTYKQAQSATPLVDEVMQARDSTFMDGEEQTDEEPEHKG